ncbi:MAG: NUDIX domain-containing protein [Microgenomates group bacterium]
MVVEHHYVVDILIYNNEGELALQKRSSGDKSFPDHWDFSAGGHIDEGESQIEAANRELFEELGIEGDVVLIGQEHLQYSGWLPNINREVEATIYKIKHNGPFKINSDELSKIEFFDLVNIQKMIDSGEKFHPEFLSIWEKGLAG